MQPAMPRPRSLRASSIALLAAPPFNADGKAPIGVEMISRLVTASLLSCALWTTCSADEPKAFACNFSQGVTHAYGNGKFAAERAVVLAFGIAAIDLGAQTADLQTERGTGHLRVVQAVNATHFLEVVTEGFLNVTTIYDKDDANGAYPAVHSRHFGILGQPLVAHYQGFCRAAG
jgi:hypothetical protein